MAAVGGACPGERSREEPSLRSSGHGRLCPWVPVNVDTRGQVNARSRAGASVSLSPGVLSAASTEEPGGQSPLAPPQKSAENTHYVGICAPVQPAYRNLITIGGQPVELA